jgi:protease IV
MNEQNPQGHGPIDPRGAFSPPPPPGNLPGSGSAQGYPPATPPLPPPPPQGYGPMMHPPQPPPRPHRTFTRAIFVTLAATIFSISLLANLYLLFLSGLMSGRTAPSSILREGDESEKVAVIPIGGLIMGDAAARFDRFITRAERDPDVKAVVLEIDTPGGSIPASDEIHNRIARFTTNRPGVPVISSLGGIATSGGYYIACATEHIHAQPTTMTGNIGAMMMRVNLSSLADRWGIEDTSIASTGTDFKTAGSILKPENEAERAYLQNLVDQGFARFKEVVAAGREGKLAQPLEEIANGKVYLATEALELGLVDAIGYSHDAYQHAATLAGLGDPTVIRYLDPPTLRALLRAESSVGWNGGVPGVTINGVNVNLDSRQLHELLSPRMMYLWQGN